MLFAHVDYPVEPLPAVAAVYLEGFRANERCTLHDALGGTEYSDLDYQRDCALYTGAIERALSAGPKTSHGDQAATLLAVISELNDFIGGAFSGRSLDDDEKRPLVLIRDGVATLLRWHFENGAGALRPIAEDLNLLVKVGS